MDKYKPSAAEMAERERGGLSRGLSSAPYYIQDLYTKMDRLEHKLDLILKSLDTSNQ